MNKSSDKPPSSNALLNKLIGLEEKSTRKSYYPQLRQQLDELVRQREALQNKNRIMIEILRDLDTQTKRAQESEAKLAKVFRATSQLIAVLTLAEARFIEISDSWMTFLGAGREEIIGRTMTQLGLWVSPDEWDRVLHRLQREGEIHGMAVNLCRPSGEVFFGLLSVTTIELDQVQSMVVEITDITALKRAEQEQLDMERRLLHTQKLESLGVLAGGIAHDFNNILMAIQGNLELALMEVDLFPSVGKRLDQAIHACGRAAELIKQILAYSGKAHFIFERVDINRLLKENIDLYKAAMGRGVTLTMQPAAHLPTIEGDPAQIQQLILNLLTNAAEAIGENMGTVTLSTGRIECDEGAFERSRLQEKPRPGPYCFIEVSDTGTGMDEHTLNRVFEPFFTTRFTGRGLGMSAVLGIVRKHEGAIFIESEAGRGTTVRVLLPLPQQFVTEATGGTTETFAGGGPSGLDAGVGSILVVDDESGVLEVCRNLMEHLGFKVLTASNGEQAVAAFLQHSHEIDCTILDLTMPGMDGLSTSQRLLNIRPDARVLLSSGYSQDEALRRFSGLGLAGFIQKPYELKNLIKAVQSITDGDDYAAQQ